MQGLGAFGARRRRRNTERTSHREEQRRLVTAHFTTCRLLAPSFGLRPPSCPRPSPLPCLLDDAAHKTRMPFQQCQRVLNQRHPAFLCRFFIITLTINPLYSRSLSQTVSWSWHDYGDSNSRFGRNALLIRLVVCCRYCVSGAHGTRSSVDLSFSFLFSLCCRRHMQA